MDSMNMINSIYTNGSYTDNTTSNVENTLNTKNLSAATDDELLSVCKDFEEYFVEQMVKSMLKMTKVAGSDDDDNSYASIFGMTPDSSDSAMGTMSSYYGDRMVTMLSEALCDTEKGQGLGLAQNLYEQMKRNYASTTGMTAEEV